MAAALMRIDGADTTQDSTAGGHSSAVESSPRGNSPRATDTSAATAAGVGIRNTDEPDIELIYLGESDNASDSKTALSASGSPRADIDRARSAGSGKYYEELMEIFGSDGSSDEPSVHSSPADSGVRGADGDAPLRHRSRSNSNRRAASGVSTKTDTTQESRDRNTLLHAPQVESPWMPSSRDLDGWAGMSTARDRIPLFDCRRLCPPGSSTETIRAEEEFLTDAFFKHRW